MFPRSKAAVAHNTVEYRRLLEKSGAIKAWERVRTIFDRHTNPESISNTVGIAWASPRYASKRKSRLFVHSRTCLPVVIVKSEPWKIYIFTYIHIYR